VTEQAYALMGLLASVTVCALALGFALGRLTGPRRHGSRAAQSEQVLASALEDGLARLRAQQKAMSDRAEASERLSAQIVESLSAGLLLVDARGVVELLNPAGRRLLHVSGEDSVGRPVSEVLGRLPALASLVDDCVRTHSPVERRTVELSGADRVLHVGVTLSPLTLGDSTCGVICLFSDLTRVVEMEDQLRLRDALARLGELTAGLAHEFRNGLATIHGYGRLLDPSALPAPYASYVEGLRAETDALGRMVTNFLGFAKPESLTFSTVSLGVVARRAVDELRLEVPEHVTVSVQGQFAEIDGDEQLLKQALDNLLRNAVAACLDARRVPTITIRGEIDHAEALSVVTVDDNGPGIPTQDRERAFQPFFTKRASGTGLGLAIVQKVVLAHNGTVSIGVSPEGGARLRIALPLAHARSASPELRRSA
jgi:signal transduction histidine kinase